MKVLFVSLGCDKNLVDTEHMLSDLVKHGIEITNNEDAADVVIINTCCFIQDAMEESINTILEYGQLKSEGVIQGLLVTGCLAQRYQEEIKKEIPEVDGILGTNSFDEIFYALEEIKNHRFVSVCKELKGFPVVNGRVMTTGGHYSYLKIAEGCDKHCTYCVIPSIRGSYRSVPIEELIKEATELAQLGVKELILVAQETTLYGVDLYGKKSLVLLLQKLSEIDGLQWIRLLYCYPEEITEELAMEIARNPKICHYIDMPIQHCNQDILKRMGRKTSKEDIIKKIQMLRSYVPDITLRTTVICGFPGETQAQHEELLKFVEEMKFDRLGAFAYSKQEGTPAAKFSEQVSDEVKKVWTDEIMALQQEICFENNIQMVGKTLSVLIEGKVADEAAYVGRTYKDAPDVDGYFFLQSGELFHSGDMVSATVTSAYEYDLIGEIKE